MGLLPGDPTHGGGGETEDGTIYIYICYIVDHYPVPAGISTKNGLESNKKKHFPQSKKDGTTYKHGPMKIGELRPEYLLCLLRNSACAGYHWSHHISFKYVYIYMIIYVYKANAHLH